MKISYVVTRSDQMSGPQTYIRDLAVALAQCGHEVTLLAGGAGPFFDDMNRRGILSQALKHMVAPIRPIGDARALVELVTVLRRIRPDLLSTNSTKAGVLGRLAARMVGIPAIHTAHGWAFTEAIAASNAYFYRIVERTVAPLATRIITVCDYDRQLAIRGRIAPSSKFVTVHNGISDVNATLRADPSRDPVRLVMVARLEKQKDHPTLFRALSGLMSERWILDVVGDGPERRVLELLAGQLGIGARVRFLGARNDVADLLAASQAFMLMSNWEGFPYSILEAMRAGLPVVASDVAGVREAVVHGQNGFLTPRGDADTAREQIAQLVHEPGLRVQMGRIGRQRYEERFTFDVMLARTCEVYEQAVGKAVVAA